VRVPKRLNVVAIGGDGARERVRGGLRRWFRSPPRRHGEVVYTREVSFLELFYDLVYVVVVGRAAVHLAVHVDWRGAADFAVVFGLIWLAWFNGTFWHELHAREDGRSRLYIFLQMGLIALLAVFAGNATGVDGPSFAITYAILFGLFTWQWYVVHRIDDPQYRPATTRYLLGMVATVIAVSVSAVVGDSVRTSIWAVCVVAWVIGGLALMSTDRTPGFGVRVTASIVERLGLFTIIVLGEVVVGVVGGISDSGDRTALTIATGMVGLTIGMGIWWNYFDLLGRRVPDQRGRVLAGWLFSHLPLTMAIAASGAAMVSLVEHATDARTPAGTAWLLAGSVVVVLAALTLAARALPVDAFPPGMTTHVAPTCALAAALTLVISAVRPAPIVLGGSIAGVLALTWFWLFVVFLALGGGPDPTEDRAFGDG